MKTRKLADRLFEMAEMLAEVDDLDTAHRSELVDARAFADELKSNLATIISILDGEIVHAADGSGSVYGDTHEAVVKPRPSKVTTDWPLALPAAIRAIDSARLINEETGEVETLAEGVARLLPDLVPMSPSVRPKKTGATLLGLDLDRYQTLEWSSPSVRLVPIEDVDAEEVAA